MKIFTDNAIFCAAELCELDLMFLHLVQMHDYID